MLHCNHCHTKLIYRKKTNPKTAEFIRQKYGVEAEKTKVIRGIVVYGYTDSETRIEVLICPNCRKLNYLGVPKIV